MSVEKLPQSVLEEPDAKELIESRKINPEDFYVLEEVSTPMSSVGVVFEMPAQVLPGVCWLVAFSLNQMI